jgi:futalosine hydrolase
MKILYVTATVAEARILDNVRDLIRFNGFFRFGVHEVHLLISGIGSVSMVWNMYRWISANGIPDLAINGGIAGSFSEENRIGDIVMPVSECFADLGIEDHNEFYTLSEAKLTDPDETPFMNGYLAADERIISWFDYLKPVKSITVNTATGSQATCERLQKKFHPDIETMEGAGFFYLCRQENIPFLAVRAISNRIEPRNRKSWNLELALGNLAAKLNNIFITLDLK